MRVRPVAVALLLLAGCSANVDDTAVPSDVDIARLEARLAEHPCVGDLKEWERSYRFSRKTGLFTPYSLNPDLDVIEFHFRRAGTISIEPALKVMAPGQSGDWPDSAAIQSLEGRFTIAGGSLRLPRCKPIQG